MAEKKIDPEQTEHQEATVLSAREAMTIISSSAGGGSAEESATSEDRGEHDESDDSD